MRFTLERVTVPGECTSADCFGECTSADCFKEE
jgi:hypothetical protein